jgi:ribonuclease-3
MTTFQLPKFQNPVLRQQALTHRSYVNEQPQVKDHNERLEFLGDAVLNFLCGEFLYKRYPELPEGQLTCRRAALVDEKQLAKFALALDLGAQLRLGKGAEQEGGRQNPNLLSSAFEALIGAYYLDCDSRIDPVRQYIEPFFLLVTDTVAIAAEQINYKSQFQHWALTQHGENPKYEIVAAVGPDHNKQFTSAVFILGQQYGMGSGRTKQLAEKTAARDALTKLGLLELEQGA